MRTRYAVLAAGLLFAASVVAACSDTTSSGDCYEPTGTAYPVRAPNDSTVTFRWPASFYPVRFWAEPTGNTVQNTDAAMQLWLSGLHCGELQLTRVTDSAQADVVVHNPAILPASVSARVFFADTTNACRGRTDIDVDSASGKVNRPVHVWVAPFGTDTALVNACYRFVTAHEIGHSLGMLFHSPNPDDIMYNRPHQFLLTDNDKYTFQLLYRDVHPTLQPESR